MQSPLQSHRHRRHPPPRKNRRQVRRLSSLIHPHASTNAHFTIHSSQLTVHYFALLRDQRGLDEESLESSAATAAELYAELAERHGFTLPNTALKVAVNDDFASWDTPLSDGDTIVFIPPVAGG